MFIKVLLGSSYSFDCPAWLKRPKLVLTISAWSSLKFFKITPVNLEDCANYKCAIEVFVFKNNACVKRHLNISFFVRIRVSQEWEFLECMVYISKIFHYHLSVKFQLKIKESSFTKFVSSFFFTPRLLL